MKATERNRVQVVAALLDRNKGTINVDSVNTAGNTALMIACEKNHTVIASLLLQHGADINKANNMKYTSLILAAEMACVETMNVLLAYPMPAFVLLPPPAVTSAVADSIPSSRSKRRQLSTRTRSTEIKNSGGTNFSSSLPLQSVHRQYMVPNAAEFNDKAPVNLNAKNVFGKNALMMGSENGHLQVIDNHM